MTAPTIERPVQLADVPLVDADISTATHACIKLLDSAAMTVGRSAAATARWNAFLASQGVTR